MSARSLLVAALVILGLGIEALACLGLVRMRDTYARLHYVGFAGFGLVPIAAALFVEAPFSMLSDKAIAAAAVVLLGSPVLVQVTARAARRRRLGEWKLRAGERVERIEP